MWDHFSVSCIQGAAPISIHSSQLEKDSRFFSSTSEQLQTRYRDPSCSSTGSSKIGLTILTDVDSECQPSHLRIVLRSYGAAVGNGYTGSWYMAVQLQLDRCL